MATLHVRLDFTVSKSPLVPFHDMLEKRHKKAPKSPKICAMCTNTRNQARAVSWATWLNSKFRGHLVHPQPPTFYGFHPSELPNEPPRPLYQWSLGGAGGQPGPETVRAEELKAFMNADDPGAAETLVNALNHWQRMVFEIFVAHFQQQQPKDVPDISTHCRASIAGSRPQLCAIVTGVAGTGKSHVVRLLIAKLRACRFSILVYSF